MSPSKTGAGGNKSSGTADGKRARRPTKSPAKSRSAKATPRGSGGPPGDSSARTDRDSELPPGPPEYDPSAVGRVARRVQITSVELLGAHFERSDDQATPSGSPIDSTPPEIGIDVSWSVSESRSILGCVLTFGTLFDGQPPYSVIARFRLLYSVGEGEPLPDTDFEQFAHWNAMFNAWPYWREYLSSTINRANLPRFLVPVMGIPLAK